MSADEIHIHNTISGVCPAMPPCICEGNTFNLETMCNPATLCTMNNIFENKALLAGSIGLGSLLFAILGKGETLKT